MKREYTILTDGVYLINDKGVKALAPKGSRVMLTETKAAALVNKVKPTSGVVIPPQAPSEVDDAPPQAPPVTKKK